MIVCDYTEQQVFERLKNIIRDDLNTSDVRAGSVAIKIIKYLKRDMYDHSSEDKLI